MSEHCWLLRRRRGMRFSLFLVTTLFMMFAAVPTGADRLDPWESRVIRIGPYEFDTRQGEPVLPEELRAGSGEMWLVQLEAPIREEAKDGLRAMGVEFYDYVPNNTFICRVPSGREAMAHGSAGAVWMGRYHPAYKLSTTLHGVTGPAEITVLGFPWQDGPELVRDLERLGARVQEWAADPLNVVVRGSAEAEAVPRIAGHQGVYFVEQWFRPRLHNHQAQWVMQTNQSNDRRLWDAGLDGEGQVGSTSDSGIFVEHNMFRDPAVTIATWGDYPTHRKVIAYVQGRPGADFGDDASHWWHGTHTAGSMCGDDSYCGGGQPYDGMALLGKDYFIDLGASNGGFNGPPDMWTMFDCGYYGNAGGRAFVHSMSWGGDTEGQYGVDDRACDMYIWCHKDCFLVTSAGNNPPNVKTGSPANAKDILSVGASKNGTFAYQYCTWSAHGPTQDGRYKPDILAPGEVIWSSEGPGCGTYAWETGTSMSSPIVAGSALQVRQYLEEGWYPSGAAMARDAIHPSAALMKAIMINGGDENIGGYAIPSNYIGWGRTCLDSVLYLAGDALGLRIEDDTLGVQEGCTDSYQYDVQSGAKLEVTLAWSDFYAAVGANPTIVNDLDLEVQAPGGAVYKGNVYSSGWSCTGGTYDRINTVECVHIAAPTTGIYTVRVIGHDVPAGSAQPYALVLTGDFGGDTQPPNDIDDLSIQQCGADVVLTWSDPGDDVGVIEYRVYRSTCAHFQPCGIPCATVSAPTTTWTDPNIAGTPSLNFFYNVRARDAVGHEGAPSNYVGEFDHDTSD
jgi:hypothetical protein